MPYNKRFRRKKDRAVYTSEEYKNASTPTKNNSLLKPQSQEFLKEVFSLEKNNYYKLMAIKKIEDQDFLEEVALNDHIEYGPENVATQYRCRAIRKCQNKKLLTKIALDKNKSELVRKGAILSLSKKPKSAWDLIGDISVNPEEESSIIAYTKRLLRSIPNSMKFILS